MEKIYKDLPLGLVVYGENFEDYVSFNVAIEVTVDPVQYWRDRPLFLKRLKPRINTVIDSYKHPKNYIDHAGVLKQFKYLEDLDKKSSEFQMGLDRIFENIEKYSEINEGESLDIDYPALSNDRETLEILNDSGEVVDSIETPVERRERKAICNNSNISEEGENAEINAFSKPVTLLDKLPEDYTDDDAAQIPDYPLIVSLPDSYIKDKLWISENYTKKFLGEIQTLSENFRDDYSDKAQEMEPEDYDEEHIVEITEALGGMVYDQWYGIPLISLSPPDVPLKDSFILHIDTKHDWTLHLLNAVSGGLTQKELRIEEVQLTPGKRFSAGVYISRNRLTIYLKINGDDTLYEKSISIDNKPEFQLYAYGTDSHGVKHLCGYIWDYFFWSRGEPGTNPLPIDPPPLPPGEKIHNYDNHRTRIHGNYLYTRRNWQPPAYNGGDWIEFNEEWDFIKDGYVTNFFCRDQLVGKDFTILWYQYQHGYPDSIRTIMADSIYNNYVRYDYDNFQLIIDFNNIHHREYLVLPAFVWFQVSIRYKQETGEFIVAFIDFWGDYYFDVNIHIGTDLKFELGSLHGRLNRETGYYEEIGEGYFGLTTIMEEYKTTSEIRGLYNDHKSFITDLDIDNGVIKENK
jgi:hypothetical protein